MKILSLIFIILLSHISCRTTQTSQPKILLASTTGYETVGNESYTGIVSNDKMKEKITNLINGLIDEFLNDYRKVKSEQGIKKQEAI
jgi:hypothetical protein